MWWNYDFECFDEFVGCYEVEFDEFGVVKIFLEECVGCDEVILFYGVGDCEVNYVVVLECIFIELVN